MCLEISRRPCLFGSMTHHSTGTLGNISYLTYGIKSYKTLHHYNYHNTKTSSFNLLFHPLTPLFTHHHMVGGQHLIYWQVFPARGATPFTPLSLHHYHTSPTLHYLPPPTPLIPHFCGTIFDKYTTSIYLVYPFL